VEQASCLFLKAFLGDVLCRVHRCQIFTSTKQIAKGDAPYDSWNIKFLGFFGEK
jgi:hypothetical protein